jgi:protein O-mannosyl-transferase
MILLDYWPLKRFESQKGRDNLILWQLKEKIPFFILSAVFSIITLFAQYKPPTERLAFPLASRLANASVSFVTYLEKIFMPHDLAVFYPFSDQLPIWQILGASLLILVITAVVIVMIKRLPYLFAGWLWYAITLAPVIGIIQVGDFAMADRYTYIPSIGIAIMLAWGIPSLIKSEDMRKMILLPVGIAMIAVLAVLTWQQCGYWKNSIELFNHALKVTKDNYLAHNNLGLALFAEGKVEEAIDHYNMALLITPDYVLSYNNRGIAYAKLGQYQLAVKDYNEAIRMKPREAPAYLNRGNIYKKLGQYQRAIEDYNEVIRLRPDDSAGYFNRGNTYISLGRYQTAIEDFNKVIRLDPASSDGYNNRGVIYIKLGRYQQAFEDYSKAILLKPDYTDAYINRALVCFSQGDKLCGCQNAQKACALGDCATVEAAKVKGYCH